MLINLLTTQLLGLRLRRTASLILTRVPERLSQGVLRKGFRQGQTLLILAKRSNEGKRKSSMKRKDS